jgi:signal transduction histidine kinase/CheY-like chemotaxis protein
MKKIFFFLLLINIMAFSVCFGNNPKLLLSTNEIEWLNEHKNNIRFAPDPNWMPVDYVDSEGVHQGIVAEMVKIIENKLDISFNLVYFNAWADGLHGMRTNEVDFMGSVQRTEERERYLNFTDPYIIMPIVILVRKNYSDKISSEQINKMQLAGVREYAYVEYINNTYPEAEIIEYDDNLTALLQTSIGNADGVIIDLMSASALIEKYNITNLMVGKTLEYSLQLRFATRKDMPILTSILDKVLGSIDESEKEQIIRKWVNIQTLDPDNFFEKYYKHFTYIGIFFLTVLVITLYINYSLKKKISEKTKNLQKEINEKNVAIKLAKQSDELKSAFLNNLSHEIRTPMNAIVGFSTLLRKKKLDDQQIEQFTLIIDDSAQQLLNIVDDVLDMAHIESKQVLIKKEVFDLQELMRSLYDRFLDEAYKKNIDLKLIVHEPEIIHLYSDKFKLRQVITNLLVNAFKFTFKGEIVFGYAVEEKNIRFFVKDTGIGIPKDLHEKIFERFYKIERKDFAFLVGSGLGLSISKGYVELLGGDIWLESSVEEGTELCFTIPYEITRAKPDRIQKYDELGESQEYDFSNTTILVAEDDKYNQIYLEKILSDTNARVIMAMNGKEAINYVNENPEIKIALLDIKMPVMDGLEAAKEIRRKYKSVILIAQTAYSQDQEKELAIQAGFDVFLSKPIDRFKLLNMIKSYIK